MLPAPPLGTRPEGLLDFLGVKTGGAYPQHLQPELVPVIELTDLYVAQKLKRLAWTQNISSFSAPAGQATIPSTERWWIRRISVWAQSIAGTITKFIPEAVYATDGYTFPAGNGGVLLGGRESVYVGGEDVARWEEPQHLILPPGTIIYSGATYAGTGTAACSWWLEYVQLPI